MTPQDVATLIAEARALAKEFTLRADDAGRASRLALQLAEVAEERQTLLDQAIVEHGQESGFWGRMAARATLARKKAESQVSQQQKALERLASNEAMGSGWFRPNSPDMDETQARIDYARAALSPQPGPEEPR